MGNLNKDLKYSLKWLSIESITYHAIFLAHQALLFKFTGAYTYGIISTIFSIIYLATTITTFGLESSLSPFFSQIMANKKSFKNFFIAQIAPTILLSALAIPILAILKKSAILSIQKFGFLQDISYIFIFTIFILILSESVKKTLRGLLYLNFKNKINMAIEILSLLAYVTTIWGCYAGTGHITVNLIFIPFAVTSVASSIILLIYTHKIYSQLPSPVSSPENTGFFTVAKSAVQSCSRFSLKNIFTNIFINTQENLQYKIFKIRAINFASQFTHSMFSSNFLVPFFALQFGLAQAGIFKLLSHITYTITMIMRKIFGWASDTLLAQTKNLELAQKQDMFHDITSKINNIMLALVIFLTINLTKIIKYANTAESIINWPLVYFFLAITLIENLFISYEKFYIAEEKNGLILAINALSIITLFFIIFYSQHFFENSQTLLLFLITATRATFFLILVAISFYKWRIKPKIVIKPIYVAISILLSLVAFGLL